MKKFFGLVPLAVLTLLSTPAIGQASVADSWPVPLPDADGKRGATMPYTRYDCNTATDAELSGGASIKTSPDWHHANIASQASNQAYVDMPVGSSVKWTMNTYGDGVTVRYTIADKNAGSMGYADGWKSKEGQLDIYVNGTLDSSVPLTSYHMYQYFNFGAGTPSRGQSSGDAPAFAFDEKHVKLNHMLQAGDIIEVRCVSGESVGVDFLEIEVVPEPIDPSEIAGGRQVFNVTDYGASLTSKDNRGAFTRAVNEANKVGGVVYIPEGTWLMGCSAIGDTENQQGLWSINPKNIMITGAGMWYTNIQFTGWGRFGGGVSGGNPSNTGGNNTCDNVEFCNLYLNSNLCDRYGENAVYKGIMDIWCSGSVFHHVWVEHFECGFWLGDYNDATARCSDGLRIADCRIRNNFADGVNFCLGTSEAAVFNCSVRNNGDDGLANWNDSKYGAKDEYDNIFAYNTIDLMWRAGAIALYGGINQKAYNNYICDTFMASGIHLNTTFDGHKFTGTTSEKPILFENNYLVRAGTVKECWGRNYAAIDIEGECKNVVFRNNHVYECPGEAVRIMNSMDGIVFDGLYVNGSGLAKRNIDYSGWTYNPGAGCFPHGGNTASWTNFQIVEGSVVPADMSTGWKTQQHWPFWDSEPSAWEWVSDPDWADTPPYPDAENIMPVPNPFDELRNYDVKLSAIDWISDRGLHSTMYDGDKVTFKIRLDNTSATAIPSGAKFAVTFSVDDKSNYSFTVKDGIPANSHIIVEFPATWTATKGKHTFTATVDPSGKMLYETDRTNNTRVKNVNVDEIAEDEPDIVIDTHAGTDVGIVKVWFENLSGDDDEVGIGDRLLPHAIVANYGNTSYSFGSGKGVVWKLDGGEYTQGIVWFDGDFTLAPGEYREVTPNGGGAGSASGNFNTSDGSWTWTVKSGAHTLTAQVDNAANYGDTESDNNALTVDVEYPTVRPEFNPNPDKADRLDPLQENYWPYEGGSDIPETTGFDLNILDGGLTWAPYEKTVTAGQALSGFAVLVKNTSSVVFPEGKAVKVTITVDGKTIGTTSYSDGINPNEQVIIEVPNASYTATAGGHVIKATLSTVKGELTADNNSCERTLNAEGENSFEYPSTVYETGFSTEHVNGRSIVMTKIAWRKINASRSDDDYITPGDDVRFTVTLYNNGTEATPHMKHGILFETMPSYDPKYWSDNYTELYSTGIQPGQTVELTTCGGTGNNGGIWKAVAGTTNFRVWIDNCNDLGIASSTSSNHVQSLDVEVANAPKPIEMIDNPTGPDKFGPTAIENIFVDENVESGAEREDVWFNLQGIRIPEPSVPGIYIRNGEKVVVRP